MRVGTTMANIKAPCALCTRETTHNILEVQDRSSEEGRDKYYFLSCAGCDAVSMANLYDYGGGEEEARYYPSPVSRKAPSWLWELSFFGGSDEGKLGSLLNEIYQAVQGKQYRLAVMGIRAFLEQLMVVKVGDKGTFEKNLEAFYSEGYISKIQKNAMSHILDSGHAVIHRMHNPTEQDLAIALDITESITAAIFFHEDNAKTVADRVPPRKTS
jgi:Domain of unknown function (DUF4145)